MSKNDPDMEVVSVFFSQDEIQVHQSRVKKFSPYFPNGFYWYGSKRQGPGRPPKELEDDDDTVAQKKRSR